MRRPKRYRILILVSALVGCIEANPPPQTDSKRFPSDYRPAEALSLLGRPLYATPPAEDRPRLEAELEAARSRLALHPNDPEEIVWVGRRLAYLWRMTEAIEVFSKGIESHHSYAPLYRHRGHRYLTIRQFDKAIADLTTASRLITGQPDEIEPDGMPNARNIPLTTTAFNVWYHLGLAKYLKGDFDGARAAFEETLKHCGQYDDNLVAASDWLYMTLRRMDRDEEAAKVLEPITPDMDIIENQAYHKRLLMYKGLATPEDLLNVAHASDVDLVTMGYGVGNWYLYNGDRAKAVETFERVAALWYWPAFGHIAAEADLARMRGRS
ncbi:MAG TPA: tetratricopeptide repeat protein [Phycisphaerae bacterium]|nr:tetratricopeptide repeat protein [Phycisphaerae bacterium]